MRTLALASAALALAGCHQLDQLDVTRSATATVPGASGQPAIPPGAAAGLGVDAGRHALEDAGIKPSDVDSARVRTLRLQVQSGASLETWLDRIAFYAEGGGQPRTLVAERTGIRALPAGTTAVDLDTSGVDLKPFVTADDGRITVEAEGVLPPVDTVVQGTVTLRVDVNVAGFLGL